MEEQRGRTLTNESGTESQGENAGGKDEVPM